MSGLSPLRIEMKPYYRDKPSPTRTPHFRIEYWDVAEQQDWVTPSRCGKIKNRKAKRRGLNKKARQEARRTLESY